MPNPVIACYRARDGTAHHVSVDRMPAGRWRVLDRAGATTRVVETLVASDDGRAQACALARDDADEQQAFGLGVRTEDPLPVRAPIGGDERRCAA